MSLSFTEAQMQQAGFLPSVPGLPHVLRGYQRTLPGENILVLARPAREQPRHLAVEFNGTKPVRHYWLTTHEDLTTLTNGQLAPVQLGSHAI